MNERTLRAVVSEFANRLAADLGEIQARLADPALDLDAAISDALDRCLVELAKLDLSGEANRLPSAWLWNANRQWLEQGVLQRRAREKPLGYAGDFQLLDWIANNTIHDDSRLGAAFDGYFQRQAAPQAVRGRVSLSAQVALDRRQALLKGRPLHWLSIGGGPVVEIQSALQAEPHLRRDGLTIELWDLDPRALQFAESRLNPLLQSAALKMRRENLFRIARGGGQALPECDLLTCLGLFDYLEQADAAAMLRAFWTALRPGGRLLVFNFDPAHSSRLYMEWIGNWYLIYRREEDMHDLAARACLPSELTSISGAPAGVAWRLDAVRD